MPNVVISADSTCDLSPEQREHYQVRSFPFHIEFRGRDHLDNIDITPQVLFDGFYEDKSLPQTGACSPEAYRQHFAELTADGSKVVHFNLGSALSSAYENASAAAADMEGVYVIDGKSLSTGIGLQVLAACRMRDAGMSAADIAREASELHNRSHASFVLDTMEFLAAGGRCPTLVAYLGGKLSCRPGILVDNQSGAMKVGSSTAASRKRCLSAT
ncbi:DegV family protein [Adlercreutzia sp.]|uniref:DegV family protein n=1 Tax=Adlercreutzia sp. TaxID=1872387 RepID=UPI003AB6D3F7